MTEIRSGDLIRRAKIGEEAGHVTFHSLDGYTADLPLEVRMGDDVLL